MARRLIGLDIGTNAVTVAEVRPGEPPRLDLFGQVALGREVMREGEVADDAAVTDAVSRLRAEVGLKKAAVRLGLASPRVVVRQVESETGTTGLNAITGAFEDLLKAGVIDPAKVTRSALQNAASIAGLLLTTEVLVADKPEKGPDPAAAAGAGGGQARPVLQSGHHPLRGGAGTGAGARRRAAPE